MKIHKNRFLKLCGFIKGNLLEEIFQKHQLTCGSLIGGFSPFSMTLKLFRLPFATLTHNSPRGRSRKLDVSTLSKKMKIKSIATFYVQLGGNYQQKLHTSSSSLFSVLGRSQVKQKDDDSYPNLLATSSIKCLQVFEAGRFTLKRVDDVWLVISRMMHNTFESLCCTFQ